MQNVTKWIKRGLGALFALSALSIVAAYFTGEEPTTVAALLPAVIPAAIGAWLWHWSGSGDRTATSKAQAAEQMSEETAAFLSRVNESGAFPQHPTARLISSDERPVLFASAALLMEVKTSRSTSHIGTRVTLAGVPLLLGKSFPVSKSELAEAGEGELAITPERLIFSGTTKTADVEISRIAAVEAFADGFTVNVTGRTRPMFFRVTNPMLWSQVIKNVAQIRPRGRTLAQGQRLQVL